MEQLSGFDSYLLHAERGGVHNHIAGLCIYDPASAPGGLVRFRDVLAHVSARMSMHRLFRRKLVTVPFGVDRPYWLDVADVDVEFHVRHIALPEPGDWRQLMIQVARLHSRPLDRSRPLWEIYVIEGLDRIPGLPKGAFAVYQKYHHASVDGQSAGALICGMHTSTPQVPSSAARDVVYIDREDAPATLYATAIRNSLRRTAGLSALSVRTAGKIVKLKASEIGRLASGAQDPSALPGFARAPQTRFNRSVSAHRVVDAAGVPLADVARIRAAIEGSTVNDIFLTVVGGALHHYLAAKGELPDRSLVALMPISLRKAVKAGAAAGNQVGGAPVAVHSEIGDPLARLAACRKSALAAKAGSELMGPDLLMSVVEGLPHAAADAFMRRVVFAQVNTMVSNVRGPDGPLYLAGAKLLHMYPVSIATDEVGLNHTGFSYNGVLWITAVACRDMLPDPAFYADCIRKSFAELLDAATRRPPAKPRASRAKQMPPPPRARRKPRAMAAAR